MSVVIVGGGTAGWLTALMVRSYYPQLEIKLIESEEIGILGAGEGTTPHFIDGMKHLNIPYSDLVKHCKATIKHGINFVNWNGDGKSYVHDFSSEPPLDEYKTKLLYKFVYENRKVNELSFNKKLIDRNLAGFSFKNNPMVLLEDPFRSLNNHTYWATHFDARSLAKYFRNKAEERNVQRIEGKLKQIINDEEGNVKQIILESGEKIDVAFIFDCTGFSRLIIGKHYETEWVSYSKHLPLNTALPFFIEHDGNFSAKTDAIAMKYGWIWKIPVEGRYGCGYVFDSDYINEDEALREAEEYFGMKLQSPKTFKFSAGTFRNTLVKNCMAVGLAQSFVEPLEATSIWVSYINLNSFLSSNGIFAYKTSFAKAFNRVTFDRNEQIKEFLYLHYLTKRNDSLFWQEFRQKTVMIDSIPHRLELTNQLLNQEDVWPIFDSRSWIQVCDGLELMTKDYVKETRMLHDFNLLQKFEISFMQNQENIIRNCLPNKDFLEYMKMF